MKSYDITYFLRKYCVVNSYSNIYFKDDSLFEVNGVPYKCLSYKLKTEMSSMVFDSITKFIYTNEQSNNLIIPFLESIVSELNNMSSKNIYIYRLRATENPQFLKLTTDVQCVIIR